MKTRFLLLFFTLLSLISKAQQVGMPYITNFAPEVYKASTQNWVVVQDKRGLLFFGNNDGVLEFDGITWRLIETASIVRSLAIDSTGRIYVGISGDFGYLQPDSLGRYQYKSLKEKIPLQDHEFNDIWKIFVSGSRVFFQSHEKIFVLQNEKFKVITPKESFHLSSLVNNTFYVREKRKGLLIYKNDSLQLVKGGERFANEGIFEILPFKQNQLIIATSTQGLWIYSPHENKFYKPTSFDAVDKFLLQHLVYCCTVLKNGSIALGTITGGIIVFNHQGDIQTIYNTETGLQNNSIINLYSDNNQQLWACTDNGISLVQNNLPFQHFTEKNGLKGSPLCIDYFNNRLYLGTTQYLFVQNSNGNFQTITGTESQNWQLYPINGKLLLANINGLFEIKENKAFPIITSTGFLNLCPLNNKPEYLLAGLTGTGGLCLLESYQNTWKVKNSIKGFTKTAYKIVQDKDGVIWIYTYPELYRFKLNETLDSVISVTQCSTQNGLPPNYATPCRLNSGEVVLGSEKGIYRYISATNTFEAHPDFMMLSGNIPEFQQQKNGDIWFQEITGAGISEIGVLKYTNGNFLLFKEAFYKFIDYRIDGYDNFYIYSDSAVFIGTNKGLLQYNPMQEVDYNIPYHTLIRNVFAKDSLLFGGTTANLSEFENIKGNVIPFSQNNLVFHYAATSYEDAEKNLYSYRLIGSDTTWSAWVSDVKKEYTNLYEGEYIFEVRAKNQYKVIGSTASYSFHIQPPLQRTWWAYGIYIILLGLLVSGIVKLNLRRLQKDKEHLEDIVRLRTAKIVQQKDELEIANATKDKFFSIIAHDLRNPFNILLGYSDLLIENIKAKKFDESHEFAKIIHQSSSVAYDLLENLLIWSKSQRGKILFKPENVDVKALIDTNILLLKNSAEKKGILLASTLNESLISYADKNMVLTILRNLITNAIKFSRKDDQIRVDAEDSDDNITIHVSDTGLGIDDEVIEKLFKVDEKIKTEGTANEPGTGLGLILCKEFIDWHKGKIWVESKKGIGSRFSFTLPKAKD